jgi:hypothetical protein
MRVLHPLPKCLDAFFLSALVPPLSLWIGPSTLGAGGAVSCCLVLHVTMSTEEVQEELHMSCSRMHVAAACRESFQCGSPPQGLWTWTTLRSTVASS